MSKKPKRAISPLAEVEMEALEVGREWTRKYLQRRLQRLADRQGAISPPEPEEIEKGGGTGDHDHNESG